MDQGSRFFTIITILLVAVVVQFTLAMWEQHSLKASPVYTAVAFTKAYYALDPDMADYLCTEYTENEDIDVVDDYLHRVSVEASAMGFETSFMRSRLFSPHSELVSRSDDEAVVHITATRKRNLNPIFTLIGRFFSLGQTYPVEETIHLVKEDDQWKVCGNTITQAI